MPELAGWSCSPVWKSDFQAVKTGTHEQALDRANELRAHGVLAVVRRGSTVHRDGLIPVSRHVAPQRRDAAIRRLT